MNARERERLIVDAAWQHATEGTGGYPETRIADAIIDSVGPKHLCPGGCGKQLRLHHQTNPPCLECQKKEVWRTSTDEENWNGHEEYKTREEAIAGAPEEHDLEPGQTFWVGLATPPDVLSWVRSGASFLDGISEYAYDLLHETVAEDFLRRVKPEHAIEIGAELKKVFADWLETHPEYGLADTFVVKKVTEHTAPEAPS